MAGVSNRTSLDDLNWANLGKLPEHLGLRITEVEPGKVTGRFEVRQDLVAHTGYLLAGVVLSVADILCAYGVSTTWPDGATGFTTVEVKCNFMGTLTKGAGVCTAKLLHRGRTTQSGTRTSAMRPRRACWRSSAARRLFSIRGPDRRTGLRKAWPRRPHARSPPLRL